MRTFPTGALTLLCALVAGAPPAIAQYDPGATADLGMYYGQQLTTQLMYDDVNRDNARRDRESLGAGQHSKGRRAVSAPAQVYAIANDPAVAEQAKRQFVERIRARSGDRVANTIAESFDRKNIRSSFAEQAGPFGLRADNYVDVFSAYLVVMWMTANQAARPTTGQVAGVRAQVEGMLARSGVKGSSRDRQLAAEAMMYELVLSLYSRRAADSTGDKAVLQKMANLTQQSFLKGGFNLQATVLADRGFSRR